MTLPEEEAAAYAIRRRDCVPWRRLCLLLLLSLLGLIGLEIILAIQFPGRQGDLPIRMLLSPTAIGGLIALALVALVTGRLKRPIVGIDLVRIVCWTLVGCGQGLATIAGTYYPAFWPAYAPLAVGIGRAVQVVCLLTILVTALYVPVPPPHREGVCMHLNLPLTPARKFGIY